MKRAALGVSGLLPLLLGGACVEEPLPLGHIVLYVDTDAPLPTAPGFVRSANAPPPLFDRVRIDVYREGETEPCETCSREFDLDEQIVGRGASVTIAAGDDVGRAPIARARLYRGAPVQGEPAPTVDVFVQLPELPAEGSVDVTIFLPTDTLGVPQGSIEDPIAAELGWSGVGHAGTWPPAQRTPCTGEPRAGEVCIPGGAFWMGDRTFVDANLEVHLNAERLVVLSPFWIDEAEVTVREYRDAGSTGATEWSGDFDGPFQTNQTDYCTFTSAPTPTHDSLPVNCVVPLRAAAHCASRGSALPTEAQFEYVAGALSSQKHPWGADEPTCSDAVWGRLGSVPGDPDVTGACHIEGAPPMPEPLLDERGVFRAGRDHVVLEDGVVHDLAGNVSEWARDIANQPGEPCWPTEGSQVFVDPLCTEPASQGTFHTIRGGDFIMAAYWTRAAARWAGFASPQTGFRCARADDGQEDELDCTGFLDTGYDECDRCVEDHCCDELIAAGDIDAGPVVDCALDACTACEAVELFAECGAPQALAAVGTCVTLGGSVECNPITNEGCNTAANETCDSFGDGFVCFPPPNDVELCGDCDAIRGPFCLPGSTCLFGGGVGCIKYCCGDRECGPGVCLVEDESGAIFPTTPGVGLCAAQ